MPPVQLSLREVLTDKSTCGPSLFLCSIFLLQQFTGVNSVMFYSAPVLKPLLPNLAGAIGLGVTLVNALTTVVAIFLVDVSTRNLALQLGNRGAMTGEALLQMKATPDGTLIEAHRQESAITRVNLRHDGIFRWAWIWARPWSQSAMRVFHHCVHRKSTFAMVRSRDNLRWHSQWD